MLFTEETESQPWNYFPQTITMRCIKVSSSSSYYDTRLMWNVNGSLPCCHSTQGISAMPLPTPHTSDSSSPNCHHRHVFDSFQEKGVFGTCLLHAAHGLEIDVVAFPRSQRWVPETLVSPVVTHSKGGWLWQISWGQLSSKVIRWPSSKSSLIGDRDLVALHGTRFSLCSVWVQLFHHNLVGTGKTEEKKDKTRDGCREETKAGNIAKLFISAVGKKQHPFFSWKTTI